METKKISFGFSKTTKKPNLLQNAATTKEENQIELIKCLEEKEIKLVHEKKPVELLVIPVSENQTSASIASLVRRRAVLLGEEELSVRPITDCATKTPPPNGNENIEERAARELLSEASCQNVNNSEDTLVLPVLKPDELLLEGAKEPTMEDYETIPVEQFGRAMLRGMGWVDPPPEKDKSIDSDIPIARPKGMGLGADKALKPKPLLVQPEKNEVLEIKLKAFVRILAGNHKDMYGQIEDFDDHAERVIVRMAIGGAVEIFNTFLCQPVAKKEYEEYGRCINMAKYEAYKKMESQSRQIRIKDECPSTSRAASKSKQEANTRTSRLCKQSDDDDDDARNNIKDSSNNCSINPKYKAKQKDEHRSRHDRESNLSKSYYESSSSRDRHVYQDQPSTSSRSKKNIPESNSSPESDSDASEFNSHHKYKPSKSKSSYKAKKSKKKRTKSYDNSASSDEEYKKSHKKKTKKSKRERSRSRSRRR